MLLQNTLTHSHKTSRKFRAEQYWGPVAGGTIGTSGMPLTAPGRERPPHSDACEHASAEKLGVVEASYASAIIGVLSPVSSHCGSSVAEKSSSPFPCGGPFSVPLRRPLAFRSNFPLGPMLYGRNNDAAVTCERQEGRLGNWRATNSHRIVNGQPFGIRGKKGRLLLACCSGPSCSRCALW